MLSFNALILISSASFHLLFGRKTIYCFTYHERTFVKSMYEENNQYSTEEKGEKLAKTAFILAIISIALNFFIPVMFPFILASIAIILAIISRGRRSSFSSRALHAVLLSVAGMIVSVAVSAFMIYSVFNMMRDPQQRQQLNAISEQVNGYSLDELLLQIEQVYGLEPGSLEFGGGSDEL